MNITPTLANQILSRAGQVLNRRIVVADTSGLILADSETRGQISVDALRSAQEGRIVRGIFGDARIAWCPFVYEHQTAGVFGITEEEVQVTPEAISLLQGLGEVIAHQHFLSDRIQPAEKIRSNFFKQVLTTPGLDAAETFRQADILQMNLRLPQAIIMFEITGFEIQPTGKKTDPEQHESKIAESARAVSKQIKEAFHNHSGNIVAYLGAGQFILSKGIGGEGLTTRNTMRFLMEKGNFIYDNLKQSFAPERISVGVGQYYPDLGGLRKSYQEAKLSLIVGTKVWGPGRVYHIKQVGMFVTLANVAQERKAELAHQILFPLLHDEQLYKTVQTFLSSGLNLTEAAEKLHVHRNTLIYRLDKTKKVIGLDPRVFDDALQIKLGLMFYQEA
jgi:carbohydrate diacid regulator